MLCWTDILMTTAEPSLFLVAHGEAQPRKSEVQMFNLKALTLDIIIENSIKENEKLTIDKLIELADPATSIYDIAELLCTYINGLNISLKREGDIKCFCNNELNAKEYMAKNAALAVQYNDAMTELVNSRHKEVKLRLECIEKDELISQLKTRLESQHTQLLAAGFKL